ncbi:MAG TPA: acetyl-CoA C-acetyltransferase [Acidimicrobiia bacterium]|jgi:acetyl-CoA C-acetyltransferase|nr:acetyl-CoA C-acetyltransferase [Acidimicrobiia bacterium]
MPGSVIVSSARTPIGRLSGALASLSATDLGGHAIKAALARGGVSPSLVDYVYVGQVIQAGSGQMPARQAAFKAGISLDVPSVGLNKACLSGIDAIYLADLMIQAGDADVVVASGMESMTRAPYLLKEARSGYRMGDGALLDSMLADGLVCGLEDIHMGESTERATREHGGITREAMDDLAAKSHERAANAAKEGRVTEIEPIAIPQRKGDPIVVDADEGIRPGTTIESLAGLRPAFDGDGSITAGNASQISDGAAAVVVMSKAKAEELGIEPLAELLAFGNVAGPDTSLLHQPSGAIKQALGKLGDDVSALDLIEINEAFAAVGVASMQDLGVTDEIVNVNGGAIALGHPIGMSGTRVVLTLIDELRRRGGGLGAASLCGGGGQGEAALVRV